MKINIHPSLQTPFEDFFSGISGRTEIQKLIVPIYQREFDWEEERIIRMLSDLDFYLEDQKENGEEIDVYFLGAVILERNSEEKKIFEIVDGQQRLTTFYLLSLLNYFIAKYRFHKPDVFGMKPTEVGKKLERLRVAFINSERHIFHGKFEDELLDQERDEASEPPKSLLNRISSHYLFSSKDRIQKLEIFDSEVNNKLKQVIINSKILITDDQISLDTPITSNPYGENLNIIFSYLHSKFFDDSKNYDLILDEIQSQITQYLKFSGMALIISENKDDSFKLFEVLNDTARKLTVLDLMKNYFVEALKENYEKDKWKSLKNDEEKIKGINLISDVIKSEGYAKSTYEYSYLSNQIPERPEYYKEIETPIEYFQRIKNFAKILREISNNRLFDNKVINDSLLWNLTGINSVKFHWGRQVMLAYLNLSSIQNKKNVVEISIWNNFDNSNYSSLNSLHKFYLISSDLLFKIGIVGKVNKLSSKVLPETGKKFLKKYHDILKKDDILDSDIIDLTEDLKGIASLFFKTQLENFKNNLDLLNYQYTPHRNVMKHLLYILYNKGSNGSYTLKNITLEHVEPQTDRGAGYFLHDDRTRIVNSFGNMILLGNKNNSSFGNLTVQVKIEKAEDYKNDAFISHRIFESVDLNTQITPGPYDPKNFKLLRLKENFDQGVPTEKFFDNRKEFYKLELTKMILNTDSFILNSCDY